MKKTIDLPQILSPDDLEIIRNLNIYMYACGSSVSADYDRYFNGMLRLATLYSKINHPVIKALYDKLFKTFESFPNYAEMTVASRYLHHYTTVHIEPVPTRVPIHGINGWWPWISYWNTFTRGFAYNYRFDDDADQYKDVIYHPGKLVPEAEGKWRTDVLNLYNQWGDNPPETYIKIQPDIKGRDAVLSFQKSLVDEWVIKNKLPGDGITPLEDELELRIKSLLHGDNFSYDTCFLLLHLLIMMCSATAARQQWAFKIINTTTSSIAYPNDSFINHLVLANILTLADQAGGYNYPNPSIKSFINDTLNFVPGTSDAAEAVRYSLKDQLNILSSDAGYPVNDPYFPEYDLDTRKKDVLNALNAARKITT